MQRRRPGLLAVVVSVVSVVVACGGDDADPPADGGAGDRLRIGVVYDVGGPSSQALNDAALVAVAKAEDDLGASVQQFEPDPTGSDREDLIRMLADDGVDLVLALGSGSAAAVTDVADDHPEVHFLALDDAPVSGANVTVLAFNDEQAAYLAGAASALVSGTHHLGFVGGAADEATRRSEAGFRAGARKVDPEVRFDSARVPALPDGSGPDVAAGRALALGQYGAGVDVVYGAPQAVASEVVAAAIERGGVKAVGSDVDLWEAADATGRNLILTSTVKRYGLAITDALTRMDEGLLEGGTLRYGLADGAVGFTNTGGLIPAEVLTRVEELQAQIVSSQIQVPTVP